MALAIKELLDKGYLGLVETWGSDERIVEAARMSRQGGFRGWEKDAKLLRYLYENKHATPFEFAGMVIEVKAPIMVFREWHRHRTQSYNEASARYAPLPADDYLPTIRRVVEGSFAAHGNKQAGRSGGAPEISPELAEEWLDLLERDQKQIEETYQKGLQWGVPKELARGAMTVFRFSRMRAQANLRNWFAFLTLRMDPKAQEEIRVYANAVGELIAESFPRTWELFNDARA